MERHTKTQPACAQRTPYLRRAACTISRSGSSPRAGTGTWASVCRRMESTWTACLVSNHLGVRTQHSESLCRYLLRSCLQRLAWVLNCRLLSALDMKGPVISDQMSVCTHNKASYGTPIEIGTNFALILLLNLEFEKTPYAPNCTGIVLELARTQKTKF